VIKATQADVERTRLEAPRQRTRLATTFGTRQRVEEVYGIGEEPDSNPIPVHVHHLRRQLEMASAKLAIRTIRGVGYILADTTTA
jgi:DNA-binding response OmpR family regulator